MAHALEMRACTEGVETSEQLLLRTLGCDAGQSWPLRFEDPIAHMESGATFPRLPRHCLGDRWPRL